MLTYRVKVRKERTYLWGGEQIIKGFDGHMYLYIRVEETGEPIWLGILKDPKKKEEKQNELGSLNPGQCFAVQLHQLYGVYATCAQDTHIECAILESLKS